MQKTPHDYICGVIIYIFFQFKVLQTALCPFQISALQNSVVNRCRTSGVRQAFIEAEILYKISGSHIGPYYKTAFDKLGFSKREQKERGIWCPTTISIMLKNMIYIGHLPQLKSSCISYKNHTRYKKEKANG